MLDLKHDGVRQRLVDAVTRLKCEIELPESWSDFFDHSGTRVGHASEKRRYPRWDNRTLAGLLHDETFPVLPRARQWYPVLLKNISRSGVAFIHSVELYPLERLQLLLIDETCLRLLQDADLCPIEVVRCHRVQDRCFEIGARFVRDGE